MINEINWVLLNIFWADEESIVDYKLFGCIMFDTTNKMNKYHLSLGLFCSVNHHKSSVIYIATFMSKKITESFVWVKQFHKCMSVPRKQ